MRTKSKNTLTAILSAPIKILCMAARFYMKCMEECSYGAMGGVICPESTGSSRSSSSSSHGGFSEEEEARRPLVRAVSKRRTAEELDPNRKRKTKMVAETTSFKEETTPFKEERSSYGVGVGKLGRIDENRSCRFEEEDHLEYTRSRASFASDKEDFFWF